MTEAGRRDIVLVVNDSPDSLRMVATALAPADVNVLVALDGRAALGILGVLACLAMGTSNRDIAALLGLSPRTVDRHPGQIYRKQGVENRAAAEVRAKRAQHVHFLFPGLHQVGRRTPSPSRACQPPRPAAWMRSPTPGHCPRCSTPA
jgi:hypothetical protein